MFNLRRRSLHRRFALALVVASLALALPGAGTVNAATYTRCEPGSGSYSGRCYSNTTSVSLKSIIVEQVVLQNFSSKTVTMSCSFTKTITKSFTASVSLSATAKATILGVVDLSTNATVSLSISQSSSQATTAGGSVTLKPGESVICQRLYTSATQTIKETTYSGSSVSTRTFTVEAPSTLGVRIIDG